MGLPWFRRGLGKVTTDSQLCRSERPLSLRERHLYEVESIRGRYVVSVFVAV
jgi:hypothetical protein